ncbi:hypothetical protein LSAT2_010147, partial [Lamellibrachia satsuma]
MHTIVHTFINALAINTSNYFEQSLEHPGHQEEAARGARFVQVILSCNIVLTKYALKMKPDQERVRNLLTDTVTLLCKNGLQYQTELRVQGVLGITLDDSDVFIVHINEKFGDAIGGALTIRSDEGDAAKTLLGSTLLDARKSHDVSRGDTPTGVNSKTSEVVHRRRRRSTSPALPTNSSPKQILQRPIKRLMPSNKEVSSGGVRHRSSLLNSAGSESTIPDSEEVVDVKVKTEVD